MIWNKILLSCWIKGDDQSKDKTSTIMNERHEVQKTRVVWERDPSDDARAVDNCKLGSSMLNVQERCAHLEERIQAIEGGSHYKDPDKFCLFPDLSIPPKFKAPEFKRYDGSTCPEMYLRYYCRKMSPYASQENLLIHVFQES